MFPIPLTRASIVLVIVKTNPNASDEIVCTNATTFVESVVKT